MPALVFFGAVVLPIALWFWFIRFEDRSEPEPGRLMRRCFYLAITAGVAAGILEYTVFRGLGLPDDILSIGSTGAPLGLMALVVLLVGPIEELAKYIVIRANVYVSHDFNQVFDGIVYGVTVALGFSFIENVFYFIDLYTTQSAYVFVASTIFRGLFTTLGHVTFTGVMGYYVGRAKFSTNNRTRILVTGVVYAALLHAAFDFIVGAPIPYAAPIAAILVIGCFVVFMRLWQRPDVRMVWKYTPAPATSPQNTLSNPPGH